MIDWFDVAFHALWVLGLSVLLAAFGYHDWLRQERGLTWREHHRDALWRRACYGGLALTAWGNAGLPGSAAWIRVAWLLLGASFAWDACRSRRRP